MSPFYFILYLFRILHLIHIIFTQDLPKRELCTLNSGDKGICTNFDNCNLELLISEGPNPKTCESNNDEIIVCCPHPQQNKTSQIFTFAVNKTLNNNINATRSSFPSIINRMNVSISKLSKSEQKCMEYSKIKCSSQKPINTIINGEKVTKIGQYPHMALLGYGNPNNLSNLTWQCGGTLISENFVLTAAHCLKGHDHTEPVVVHLGFLNRQNRNEFNTLQEFKIIDIIKHPDRIDHLTYADIALLKLDRPAILSTNVLPACLHKDDKLPIRGQVTGWGATVSGADTGSDDLMKVSLRILKHEDCFRLYPKNRRMKQGILEEQQFCAGEANQDACNGDSGGPLQIIGNDHCMHSIVGIVSFGKDCGLQPGVYTKVSHYLPWIESIVWPDEN